MKILIDGQTLNTPDINRGIGIYFRNTIEQILACDFANDFLITVRDMTGLNLLSPWARDKLQHVHHNGELPRDDAATCYSDFVNDVIDREGIDLYWSPNGLMANVFLPFRTSSRCRYAVTIFDLIPLVMKEEFEKHWSTAAWADYENRLQTIERDYDLCLHISRHTQLDVMRVFGPNGKKHVVTPLAAAPSFRPYPFPEIAGPENYVLYPGGFDPRKNMHRALEAFRDLHQRHGDDEFVRGTSLVMVCDADPGSKHEIAERAAALGISDKVHLAGFVSEGDLVQIYQKARCLFFPSLYEGFGLPVIEGLACGIPVAASRTSSIPEVAGDFAHYFEPTDVTDMAVALYRALREPVDLASRLRRYQYSKSFSWRETALATMRAFADCRLTGAPVAAAK